MIGRFKGSQSTFLQKQTSCDLHLRRLEVVQSKVTDKRHVQPEHLCSECKTTGPRGNHTRDSLIRDCPMRGPCSETWDHLQCVDVCLHLIADEMCQCPDTNTQHRSRWDSSALMTTRAAAAVDC